MRVKNLHAPRTADFIMGSVLASLLLLTTACGSDSVTVQEESSRPTSTPTPLSSPAVTPTPSARAVSKVGIAELVSADQQVNVAKALAVLATLPVKGRAPKTGYIRSEFGVTWEDVDKNGCDTRNDILGRDLTAKTFKAGTRECKVLTGVLADPYTAKTINFVQGSASTLVEIDHVVALSNAWQTGAQQLSLAERTALANDPLNLLAVDGPANNQKGDGDAATWLPANKSYRCSYVARQISVKNNYGLWVTSAEHDAMSNILNTCSSTPTPTQQPSSPVILPPPAPLPEVQNVPAPVPVPVEVPAPAPAPLVNIPAPPAAYYQNCTAVRAAGKAPIRVGEPGFQPKFDRDGDGVGCE